MEPTRKIRILHIITGLRSGGAVGMLFNLLGAMDRSKFESAVVGLGPAGPMAKKIEEMGISVVTLGMKRKSNPLRLFQLLKQLRSYQPDIVQTWLYHSDLIGGLASKATGSIPVVWGIHHSSLDPKVTKSTTIWTVKLCAFLSSRLATKIICCSNTSESFHRQMGYAADKLAIIYNGFDLDMFKPDPVARKLIRQELGILPETILIGLVGRFDPQKGLRNFIQAAGLLNQEQPKVEYLLCGDQITWDNPHLVKWIDDAGVRDRVHLLGLRHDIPRVMASLDIVANASNTEAFPLVVGEAMAVGIPCAVTDVGDSALIIGDTGRVVPPSDPQALAASLRDLILLGSEGRHLVGQRARQRIQNNFTLANCTHQYEELYSKIAAASR